jgi:hypothetical protein
VLKTLNKKYTKKLRNGPIIEVDHQIRLWRERMRQKKLLLGEHSEKQRKRLDMQNAAREFERTGYKKFF